LYSERTTTGCPYEKDVKFRITRRGVSLSARFIQSNVYLRFKRQDKLSFSGIIVANICRAA